MLIENVMMMTDNDDGNWALMGERRNFSLSFTALEKLKMILFALEIKFQPDSQNFMDQKKLVRSCDVRESEC